MSRYVRLVLAAISLLLLSQGLLAESPSPGANPPSATASQVWVLASGADTANLVAWRTLDNGVTLVYRKNEADVAALISFIRSEEKGLRTAGRWDDKMLSIEYWMTASCTKKDNKCQGSCTSGSCQECCVKFCSCCCR